MRCLVISATSDIGFEISKSWLDQGFEVTGTYRTHSENAELLKSKGASLFKLDLGDSESLLTTLERELSSTFEWDVLLICPATQEPFGLFFDVDFKAWEDSFDVNYINQMKILHYLYKFKSTSVKNTLEPIVMFFAGGGPNKATRSYSAYSLSKVTMIKTVELLQFEYPETRFTILNPGWVKTKSQYKMLENGDQVGEDFERTKAKFENGNWTPVEKVVGCCNWLINQDKETVGGRYLGVEFDQWNEGSFVDWLRGDSELCKLRRNECSESDHIVNDSRPIQVYSATKPGELGETS